MTGWVHREPEKWGRAYPKGAVTTGKAAPTKTAQQTNKKRRTIATTGARKGGDSLAKSRQVVDRPQLNKTPRPDQVGRKFVPVAWGPGGEVLGPVGEAAGVLLRLGRNEG